MAEKAVQQKHVQKTEVDVVTRARGFWEQNSKPIIYISSVIILLVGGWLVYKYMVKIPKEEKANDAVFVVQKYFNDFSNAPTDTLKLQMANRVLNGDGGNSGALKFISKYDGTNAANLCNYYAGSSYLHLKQFDKAIKYLKDFDTDAREKIMGKTIAKYTDRIEIINTTLFISSTVAPLKNELLYQKEKIIERVNEALGEKVITEVVIK